MIILLNKFRFLSFSYVFFKKSQPNSKILSLDLAKEIHISGLLERGAGEGAMASPPFF